MNTSRSGQLSQDEIFEVLEVMVGATVSQDQLESISNRLFREADENEDGHMTFEEFYEAISEIEIEKKMAFVSFS